MLDLFDFYILGLPIETEIGICDFIKVRDYPKYFQHLNALAITKESIIYKYYCDETVNQKETIDILKQLSLFEMILISKDVLDLYHELFTYVFNNNKILESITEETFMLYRAMIIKMNVVKEDKVNPNPEIQRWIEKSRNYSTDEDSQITFADIVSSVAVAGGYNYEQINDMSLYQLYTTFHRVVKFKSYETSTLFATVAADKINIENWCGHIDLFIQEKHGISQQEYNKKKQDIGLK